MYNPCLHCKGKKYDETYCPDICTYAEDRKRLKELEEQAKPIQFREQLTLNDLKKMYDCPVWVEVIDHDVFADEEDDFDGWGMVRTSWVRLWDAKRADLISVKYDFEDYGKEWVAYRMPVAKGEWIAVHEHIWRKDENGEIDMFAYDNDIHNGPVCVVCGEHYCVNCNPDWETRYCTQESYKCSCCENHVKVKTPYCSQCGVKMKGMLNG